MQNSSCQCHQFWVFVGKNEDCSNITPVEWDIYGDRFMKERKRWWSDKEFRELYQKAKNCLQREVDQMEEEGVDPTYQTPFIHFPPNFLESCAVKGIIFNAQISVL